MANHVADESSVSLEPETEQLDMFIDYNELRKKRFQHIEQKRREKNMQKAIITLKKKYGKNAVFKGMNLQEGATARKRNRQIGGHRA